MMWRVANRMGLEIGEGGGDFSFPTAFSLSNGERAYETANRILPYLLNGRGNLSGV
jgi:hypothetical protein